MPVDLRSEQHLCAECGTAIDNGFRLYVAEQGGKLSGREIEFVKVDGESDPSNATDNVNKLIKRDNVDVIVGTVRSGVAMAMARAAKERGTLLIVPNAGADAVTGPMCASKIDSPRGVVSISKSHNPVQEIYLRQVIGKENKLIGVTSKLLADPGRGCKL